MTVEIGRMAIITSIIIFKLLVSRGAGDDAGVNTRTIAVNIGFNGRGDEHGFERRSKRFASDCSDDEEDENGEFGTGVTNNAERIASHHIITESEEQRHLCPTCVASQAKHHSKRNEGSFGHDYSSDESTKEFNDQVYVFSSHHDKSHKGTRSLGGRIEGEDGFNEQYDSRKYGQGDDLTVGSGKCELGDDRGYKEFGVGSGKHGRGDSHGNNEKRVGSGKCGQDDGRGHKEFGVGSGKRSRDEVYGNNTNGVDSGKFDEDDNRGHKEYGIGSGKDNRDDDYGHNIQTKDRGRHGRRGGPYGYRVRRLYPFRRKRLCHRMNGGVGFNSEGVSLGISKITAD